MKFKGILKIFLITILMITILNCSYADTGPIIGENQAKNIAQDYINSHNLPFKAITPENIDALKIKVKDTKTGEVKWMPVSEFREYFGNAPNNASTEHMNKYKPISGYNDAWIVQVNDKNGKNVGRIYVDSDTGKVLKAIIDPVSQTNETSNQRTNMTNTTSQVPQNDNTWTILALALLIIVVGAGYWFYSKR